MGYVGSPTIDHMRANAEFVEITSAGIRESHVHDVTDHQGSTELPHGLSLAHSGKAAAAAFLISSAVLITRSRFKTMSSHQKILILDFGSQVTQLIARRVREQQVYCELHSYDVTPEFIREFAPPASSFRAVRTRCTRRWTGVRRKSCSSSAFPCLASATACRPWPSSSAARSRVPASANSAMPKSRAQRFAAVPLIEDRKTAKGEPGIDVWMSHGDKVTQLPPGFQCDRQQRVHADCCHCRREAQVLRGAVPSRGDAYAQGQAT